MDTGRTFILTRNDRIVGYFNLTMGFAAPEQPLRLYRRMKDLRASLQPE